jgi:hypothetical protein
MHTNICTHITTLVRTKVEDTLAAVKTLLSELEDCIYIHIYIHTYLYTYIYGLEFININIYRYTHLNICLFISTFI